MHSRGRWPLSCAGIQITEELEVVRGRFEQTSGSARSSRRLREQINNGVPFSERSGALEEFFPA